jgi:murein DD-endopeptidase MepM/ murein hydrolase activator NlpD
MERLRKILIGGAAAAALLAPAAMAAELPPASSTTHLTAATPPLQHGDTLTAPTPPTPAVEGTGGTPAEGKKPAPEKEPAPTKEEPEGEGEAESEAAEEPPSSSELFEVPLIPSSSCAPAGVPPVLIPIFERAAAAYGLGPQGPSVLAGINEVETAFGTNLNTSSAGAIGWMQFIPSSWETYGVDANGDGVRDPYNPEDAIFAAARYLSAAGMPADTYGAIYAYNHASWYVEEVLANAACYSNSFSMAGGVGGLSTTPQLQVLTCSPAEDWRAAIPADYLAAFESAAARYELGRRGVWVLAAVARLESDFGRGMTKQQLRTTGPLGLDPIEWATYAVDGNEDGHISHANPADSAATLARLIWSRGSLRAGIFTHNQAEWYVQAVLADAEAMEGSCKVRYIDWSVALPAAASSYVNPFSLSSNLVTGRVDQGVDFTGSGPIVAIGEGLVLQTGAPGWPEEGGVLYELLSGPLKGAVIFTYEGVDATVQPGQHVRAGEQIATFRPGGSIETGLADSTGTPLSHAEYYEGKVTQSGLEMLSLLQSLGV